MRPYGMTVEKIGRSGQFFVVYYFPHDEKIIMINKGFKTYAGAHKAMMKLHKISGSKLM